jgi:predicted TIM-barrel fold metal-dependent hydrolase
MTNHNWPENSKTSRRELLQAFAAAGAGALLAGEAVHAQNPVSNPRRIDVHHQYVFSKTGAYPTNPNGWTPEKSLEQMDKFGIQTTILSTAGYGDDVYDGSEKGATLARKSNDYAAKLADEHPKRFGFMAILPFGNVDASMKEIEYAFDKLKCDGVGFLSNIYDKWPGDPVYFPIFQELNRRKAVTFIHPFVPKCCRNLVKGVQDYVVEFDFDTTRAVTSMLYNGTLSKCPDLKVIVNHSGAAVPVLSGRIKDRVPGDESRDHRDTERVGVNENIPKGVFYELKRLYYECAHATYPTSFKALLEFAPHDHILFGTDYSAEPMESTVRQWDAAKLPAALQRAINRENAEKLFPKFKS